jgi:hypothetical protein
LHLYRAGFDLDVVRRGSRSGLPVSPERASSGRSFPPTGTAESLAARRASPIMAGGGCMARAFLLVMDSFGIGGAPDAEA